ncbi:J domain-containing protein [Paludibacterium paludis]|uniref:J domain-containing protein n=1 Tax=Paludibacterium paludis TaxID=1225769 RepID=A0A918P7A0_9NEIS|nr:DnaJ domain-containing protein [Paludibacterium paludis]GGY30005.1 hypothetical protein GCM10011289_36090 [Paludibacterium paludis]
MSGVEILVCLVCLFIGYWVVARYCFGSVEPKPAPGGLSGHERNRREECSAEECEEDLPATAWHKVLNVDRNADVREIRRAYQTLISQYHPDKVDALGPEVRQLCERKTKAINAAYDRAMAEREGNEPVC